MGSSSDDEKKKELADIDGIRVDDDGRIHAQITKNSKGGSSSDSE